MIALMRKVMYNEMNLKKERGELGRRTLCIINRSQDIQSILTSSSATTYARGNPPIT
jgi:hypothetical protein